MAACYVREGCTIQINHSSYNTACRLHEVVLVLEAQATLQLLVQLHEVHLPSQQPPDATEALHELTALLRAVSPFTLALELVDWA